MGKEDFVYTLDCAKKNAQEYRGYFIGTYALKGDSRYVTVMFDKDMNFLEESLCTRQDMKECIDVNIWLEEKRGGKQ